MVSDLVFYQLVLIALMWLCVLLHAQVVKTVRRRRLVQVRPRVVFGTLEAVNAVLAPLGCQINTSFVERLNLSLRQHVAAIGQRATTLCKSEGGLRQQLAVSQVYYNFCLLHVSLRQPLPQSPCPPTGRALRSNGAPVRQRWPPG